MKLASERGLKILLDVHNYARYRDQIIGTPAVPNEAFADFWQRLAAHYQDETAILGLGLMNEPHDTGGRWPAAAQAAIDAIRTVDRRHAIFVCGDGWSGAHSWKKINGNLLLNDPADNLVYERISTSTATIPGHTRKAMTTAAHIPRSASSDCGRSPSGSRNTMLRGFIGEFGVPDDDPRWLEVWTAS